VNGSPSRTKALPDLLLVAPCLPSPTGNWNRLRWHHLLKFLGQRYRVHLGCFVDPQDRAHIGRVQALCYETCFAPRPPAAARRPGLQLLTAGEARAVRACRSAALTEWIAGLQRRHSLHAALACSAPMALHLAALAGVPRLVDFVELESDRRRQLAAGRRWPMALLWRREAGMLCQHELAVARACDHLFFASHSQADLFRSIAPDSAHKVAALLNGVDPDHFSPHILHRSPFPRGCRALLLAMRLDDWPQADAAEWFAREVFARLRAADPGLRLYAIGTTGERRLRALARHQGVVVAGPVHDLRPFLAHAALALAPLHIASGAPSQALEALAMQKVLVASRAALEGVRALPDTEVLVAADADDYVQRIQWALAAPGAVAIAKAARARVAREHNWAASFAPLAARLAGAPFPSAGAL
jgi:sugar transferase (PEP-CTERM/EpsH1 system associated)